MTLRFLPKIHFGIGIVLRNRSRQPLTLVGVDADAPIGSLVDWIGTELRRWNPPPCPGRRSCPAIGFLHRPFGARLPEPVVVAGGAQAAVQLNFRLRSCAAVPLARSGAPETISVSFRTSNGHERTQLLSLGSSRLNLRMPMPRDCRRRPTSNIAIEGPFATGSDWTIPGTAGDTCTRTGNGGLVFVSRRYMSPQKPAVSIRILLPQLRGVGVYRSLARSASTRGPVTVTAIVGIGPTGWMQFHSATAVVSLRRLSPTIARGRFHATIDGYRHSSFRVFGGWACSVGGSRNRLPP